MPNYTPNINLIKPIDDERFTVDHVNDNADKIDEAFGDKVDKVVDKGLSTNDYDNTEKATVASSKSYIDVLKLTTNEPTGFTNNENITVSYDSTTRKVTLTGTFEAYFEGIKIAELVSGWESPAHADTDGTYYLYYNGSDFVFNTTAWSFDLLQIAVVQYTTAHKIGLREVHGFMQSVVHDELHRTIGSFKSSGGDFSNVTLNSLTLKQPFISNTSVKDEDLTTVLNGLGSALYTQRYLVGATAVRTIVTDQTQIVPQLVNQAYYNLNTAGTWSQALFGNNDYGAVFVVAIPVTSDAISQKYRFMFVQPQQVSTNLSVIQALTPSSLVLGDSAILLPEFVYIGKIIIKATASNWSVYSIEKLEGTKISQVSTPVGNYLTLVNHDASLTGDGTVASPLSVVKVEEQIIVALSDETTAITTGTAKATFRMPYACKLTTKLPRINVNTVSSSGLVTVDVNKSGATILTNKITIDANEKTSTTATTPCSLVNTPTTFTDDEEITCDIDVAGTGAKGLKLTLFVERT